MMSRNRARVWLSCAALAVLMATTFPHAADKLKPEEVVENHLKSIADAEVRANVRTRVAQGIGRHEIVLGGRAELQGAAYFLTEGEKMRFVIDFGNPNYLREDFAYDGDKPHVGYITPGRYSQLGDFLNLYKDVLKEGLIGGVLSTAWPLLNMDQRQPKLRYGGLKKMDGQQAHIIDYTMRKGGGDLRIKLYFEPETFRHVGTDYDVRTPASQMGRTPTGSSQIRRAEFQLTERFSDFEEIESNTLPRTWTMQLSIDNGTSGRSLIQWTSNYETIVHNQPIEPSYFDLQAKSDE